MKRHFKRYLLAIFVFSVLFGESVYQYKLYAAQKLPLENRVVLIDPGHGGWDPGKTGTTGDDEKNINLVIAETLKFLLDMGGAEAVMTRYGDEASDKRKTADLKKRITLADEADADIMISIHQNSFPSPSQREHRFFITETQRRGKNLLNVFRRQ